MRLAPIPSSLTLMSHGGHDFPDQVREGEDVVIVDAPPVLTGADALVLAQRASLVVLVVSLGKTSKRELAQAEAALRALGVPAAVILNGSSSLLRRRTGAFRPEPDARTGRTAHAGSGTPTPA